MRIFTAACLLLSLGACTMGYMSDPHSPKPAFKASLSATNETPPTDSTGYRAIEQAVRQSFPDAIVAPVFPADTMALALPSRTASAQRTSVESFFFFTDDAASSSMPMTSVATSNSRSPRSARSAGPTSNTGMPSAAACLAPATISAGALSPPMASTAIGFMVRRSD